MNQLTPLQKFVQFCIILSTLINVTNFSFQLPKYLSEFYLADQPAAILRAEASKPK